MGRPSSWALDRFINKTPATPSVNCEALPPVVVPLPHWGKAGRILLNPSAVESGRMPSSSLTRTGTRLALGAPSAEGVEGACRAVMGMISSAKMPDFWALPARWCEAAASSSILLRGTLRSLETFSEVHPIGCWQSAATG
ncbi:BQ5605_C001g00615 [Microbotryum silenes-dioicae]|uniref:BQ5605_C001g00615 protein n=1 Tax=Microbotryum silenes-dioicae TaxID=796604 RepID=A0A2X0P6B0_9BASI|nr:BQ5605_C001g00615 [Microbotryum silenes-dioicae]